MTEASSIYVRLDGKDVGLSTLLQKVDQQTQRSADNAARLQAQYARLAATQGNTAQSTAILTNAIQNNGGASERTVVSLSQQLATVQRGSTVYQEFGNAAKSSLLSIVGPAAIASAAIGGLIAAGESFKSAFVFKAQLDANASSLQSALAGYRDVGATLNEAAAFGQRYNITQAQTNSILTSSIDVLKQSSGSVTELETALLRLQTRDVSKPISEAARAVRELQAGDVTSIKELFNVPAKDALAMKNEIAGGADAIQVLTAWLDKAGVGMSALEQRTQGATGAMNAAAVAAENVTLAQAQLASSAGGVSAVNLYAQAMQGLANLLNGDVTTGYTSLAINAVASQAALQAHTAALAAGRSEAEAAALAAQVYADIVRQVSEAEGLAGAATNTHTKEVIAHVSAEQAAANAIAATASALAEDISKKQTSEAATQRLTAVQKTLADLGPAVAGGLQSAGSAAAFLASRYGFAYSEALKLVNAQAALAGVQAKDPLKGVTEDRLTRDTTADRAQVKSDQALEANRKLLASMNKQATAAGGARLSDQQKLNNQLLATQESANAKLEDAEADHQQRLLDIQIDYAQKTLQQQQQNEISKRQSQEAFYDRLTSSDLNKKKGGADALRAIDAQYQADYQRSQELAQQGKAKQSADLLALAQKQAQDELTYQENLAKAQEAKDKAEISRLEAIHKLHQDTANEERKQVLEGGDANEQAKQQAITAEEERYSESQDKIGTAAERAAERQETAAIRAGKAIDATNSKLALTKSTYDQIAPAGGGSAPVTTTGASTPPSVPSAPAAAVSDPLAAALAQFTAAQAAVERAVREAGRGIEGAVGRLQGKFAS